MKVQFKIGYYGYVVERSDIPTLMEIFSRATDVEGKFVEVSIAEVPDLVRKKIAEEVTKEAKEETARYSKYWTDERNKTAALEKRIKELESSRLNVTEEIPF